jgi:hypothetical protein
MSARKDTNPKDAVGTAKVPASTVPREVIAEVGLAMMEGALKYGRHNYRVAGVRASVYFDAATRHLDAFHEGQDIDPDSGLSHLVKAIACLVVLRDSQFRDNWVDDRPPKLPDNWQADLNAKAAALLEKYPNPLPAHTELDDHTEGVAVKTGPTEYTFTVPIRWPAVYADNLDDADIDFVWDGSDGLRYRWSTGRMLWEHSALENPLDSNSGWLAGHCGQGPFTRAQPVDETY